MTATWLVLQGAVGLDAVVGDPAYRFHPVRLMGALASAAERWLHRGDAGRVAGLLGWLLVVSTSAAVATSLHLVAHLAHPIAGAIVDILLVYSTIAPRDLARHARRVEFALADGDLPGARIAVRHIVGRDTEVLDEGGVCRAAVEAVAESTVDGVTAPLVWAAILGPVGAILYRAINTLDSMWGHHDERYERFGFAAARLDDVANYLPARLTVIWICGAAFVLRLRPVSAWRVAWQYGPRHASPNSGLSEAAFAGALGVTLGGKNRYDGQWHEGPTFGCVNDGANPCTLRQSVRLMWGTTVLATLMLSGAVWGVCWALR